MNPNSITRREMLERMGMVAVVSAVAGPIADGLAVSAQTLPDRLNAIAGVDRVVMKQRQDVSERMGRVRRAAAPRTRAGEAPRRRRRQPNPGPAPSTTWSKVSGPGDVTFADPKAAVTTATFSAPGAYVLQVTADNGTTKASSTLTVKVELPPPADAADAGVHDGVTRSTARCGITGSKALIVTLDSALHRPDEPRAICTQGPGGIDNFIEAGEGAARRAARRAQGLRVLERVGAPDRRGDEPRADGRSAGRHGDHRGAGEDARDARGLDPEDPRRADPDGYLQTAFTLRDASRNAGRQPGGRGPWIEHWDRARGESRRLHRRLLPRVGDQSLHDDGAQGRAAVQRGEEAGRLLGGQHRAGAEEGVVRRPPGDGAGARALRPLRQRHRRAAARASATSQLAKFLLDCRKDGTEYDQSHLPVVQQYEAVGHAVRAVYTYSGMADVAVETHDVDYQSAVKSLWDNIVHQKYYLTGGVGSGETSEGFGPNYSLRNNAYCESCSSCGEIFFQWKLHLAYHDAQYADLYEETMYNALLGGARPGRQELLLHEPARRERAAHAVAHLPVLRRQHPAHAADAADLDVLEGRRRRSTSTCSSGSTVTLDERRRHRRRDGAGDGLSVERQGRDHGEPDGAEDASRCGSACRTAT